MSALILFAQDVAVVVLPFLCFGCSSPHDDSQRRGIWRTAGSGFIEGRIHHGIPILQKSLYWDGNGEIDNTGLGAHAAGFVADGVALGGGLEVASWWTPGKDVYSAEAEGLLRIYPSKSWPLFLDGTAGFQEANHDIPPGGTMWNFTFGFGGGVDLPICERTSLLLGTTYHHISNASDARTIATLVRTKSGFG